MVLFKKKGFDPQALTSLTDNFYNFTELYNGFDPQALTSLTQTDSEKTQNFYVSIHRLLRA